MNINEIKEYIEQNKDSDEVKSYLAGFLSADTINPFLDTEDGKKLLQPKIDKHFTKGLETWKANNLNTLIETELAKRNPAETPEAKQIRELNDKLTNMEKATQREKLKNMAIKGLNEKGLPVGLADYFSVDTEDGVTEIVSFLDTQWKSAIENTVNERLKGKTPPAGANTGDGELTKDKIARMSVKDRMKIYNETPEIWKKIMG